MALFVFKDRPNALLQVHIYLSRGKMRAQTQFVLFKLTLLLITLLKRTEPACDFITYSNIKSKSLPY